MSDTILGALIGGSFALAGILIEKLFVFLVERHRGNKEFFNDFFPKRLEAHQKIMGTITKCGFDHLKPEISARASVKVILKDSRKLIEAVFYETLLVAEKHVSAALIELSPIITEALGIKGDLEEKDSFRDILKILQGKNSKLIKLLREKSGEDVIDQEFSKLIKRLKRVKKPGDKAANLKREDGNTKKE